MSVHRPARVRAKHRPQEPAHAAARRPGTALERRFPLPAWTDAQERRYGRQLEIVAGFNSARDPGRDIRTELGLRNSPNDWFIDLRQWLAGTPTATGNGLRLSLTDWPAFSEMVSIVTAELIARGILTTDENKRTLQPETNGRPA